MIRIPDIVRRHKHWLGIWMAVEIASIPAAAQIVERVAFRSVPKVIVADGHSTAPGVATFYVASNAPFAVEVGNVVGEVAVEVSLDAALSANAQMPGEAHACTQGRFGTVLAYAATRKTAAHRGEIETQAVKVEVFFDGAATPAIQIVPLDTSLATPGAPCRGSQTASS